MSFSLSENNVTLTEITKVKCYSNLFLLLILTSARYVKQSHMLTEFPVIANKYPKVFLTSEYGK